MNNLASPFTANIREKAGGRILNVIPLKVARSRDLQNAVDEAFNMVIHGTDRFEELSTQILAQLVPNSVFENETRILVQVYQDIWVGLHQMEKISSIGGLRGHHRAIYIDMLRGS